MTQWPDNKRIAVMLAFDIDAETMWTTRGDGNEDHITNLSRGTYGPKQGIPRILDMLDVHQVKATFFIPGVIAEKYDYSLELFLEHGYIYSSNWRDSDGPFLHQIDGKTVPLVELPKDSIFDDTAYDFYTDSAHERYELKTPDAKYEISKEQIDSLAD